MSLFTALRELLPEARAVVFDHTADRAGVPQERLRGDPELVRRAVSALPNTTDLFPTYDDYIRVGAAIKAALPDDGDALELFQQWCGRWPEGNDPERVEADWRRLKPPFGIGAQWLYDQATRHGAGFDAAQVWFRDESDLEASEGPGLIKWIDPAEWAGRERPQRHWIVRDVIPDGEVTLLTGRGGVGKTLLAQQAATCVAAGLPWLGRDVRQCKVMAFLCEDPEDELQGRQMDINSGLALDMKDLSGRLRIASRKYMDNLLALWDRNAGAMRRTAVWETLSRDAKAFGAKLVIVDTAADTFGGDEINRQQVRQFIQSCLGRLAAETGGAVLLLAHPSRTGEQSGEGTSGSTAWHASVRSRLYLDYAGEGASPMRKLENKKANYAARGDTWLLRWRRGSFEVVSATTLNEATGLEIPDTADQLEKAVFAAVAEMIAAGARASLSKHSKHYAPRVLRSRSQDLREQYSSEDVEAALMRLVDRGQIVETVVGRDANRHTLTGLEIIPKAVKPAVDFFE